MNINFLVRVSCMTFNHAPYIEDAMNGFCMQETTFPFVCTIMDDASTDGEPEVIKKYLQEHFDLDNKELVRNEETDDYEMTFAQHKTNKNCYFAVYFLKYNHHSIKKSKIPYIQEWQDQAKYIALCEGDDYWIDEKKLEKQTTFLESHPDYGMVYTAYRQKNEITGKSLDIITDERIRYDDTFKWSIIEQRVMIGTCTTLRRQGLQHHITETCKEDYNGFLMGDTQTWFHFARLSRVGYLRDVTGVYRKQPTGATATFQIERRKAFIKSCLDLHLHLAFKYGAPIKTIQIIKSIFGFGIISLYVKCGDKSKAFNINREYFNNSKIISFAIKAYSRFNIKYRKGLGALLVYLWKIGLVKIDK